MELTGNVVLVTGGGSGIGRALAEALHRAGNEVVVTGRRASALDGTVRANPGMTSFVLDVDDASAIVRFAGEVTTRFPRLNVLVNNAGIMKSEDLKAASDLAVAEATISTNLLAPLRLTSALLPTLLAQPRATIVTVSSGLAFVPIATNPAYCATKAAIHSWSQSLRYQLRDTAVDVLELAPPYVQTELTGAHQASDPNAMPLDEFTAEVMALLSTPQPHDEILVKRVHAQRFAERTGTYDDLYAQRNEQAAQRAAAAR